MARNGGGIFGLMRDLMQNDPVRAGNEVLELLSRRLTQAVFLLAAISSLAVLLLVGSTLGAQVGAVFGRKLKADQLKILLALIVLGVTVKIIFELTMTPSLLLSLGGGHG